MTSDAENAAGVVAAARHEIETVTRDADERRCSLQDAVARHWTHADGPAPAGVLLALWSLGVVATHWREQDDELSDLHLLNEVAGRRWAVDTIRVEASALSRMLLDARPPFAAIRAAARVAAGAISRIDGGVSLVAHHEIAKENR